MNETNVPPVLSMLNAAKEVFDSRKNFRLIFTYTFLTGMFILIESISFIVYIFTIGTKVGAISLDIVVTFILVLGLPLLILSPFSIYYSRGSVRKFESFVSSFYPIFLSAEVDLFVSNGESLNDSIISIIKSIDRDFERAKNIKDISDVFDIILKAKRKVATVAIMNEEYDYSKAKLKDIQTSAIEVSKKMRKKFCLLIIINTGQNNLNEIELNKIKGLRTIILEKTENGFKLNYVSK